MNAKEFSVVLWFPDGSYHYEKRFVSAEEAITTAADFIKRPAAKAGLLDKVMVTDGGDHTNFLWEYGKGIVFPTREQCAAQRKADEGGT